jgi:hypothetical protein
MDNNGCGWKKFTENDKKIISLNSPEATQRLVKICQKSIEKLHFT